MKRGKGLKRTGFSQASKDRSREKALAKKQEQARKPLRRVGKNRHYRNPREIDSANKRAFKQASFDQRVCAVCGRGATMNVDGVKIPNPWQAHHVVEKQKLRAEGRMDVVWDIRNSLRLCEEPCHGRHTRGSERVGLSVLTDDNYEFAWHVLGMASADYLRKRYNGKDPRWDALKEKCDEALAAERDCTMPGQ